MVALNPYFRSVDQIFSGRTGKPYTLTGERSYLTRWRVIAKMKELGPESICVAPGIPRPWSFYDNGFEFDPWCLLTELDATQEHNDDWQSWIVSANYSTRMPAGGPLREPTGAGERPSKGKAQMNNPENDPPDIRWSFDTVQRALPKDLDGTAFLNSAQQPFSPAPTFEVAYAVLQITRNELDFQRTTATRYAYAVNSDVFMGCKPETVQCMPPEAEMQWRGPLQYWRVTYRLRFGIPKFYQRVNRRILGGLLIDPLTGEEQLEKKKKHDDLESWQPEILDVGTHRRIKGNPDPNREGQLEPIIKMGVTVTSPVLLDGQGQEAKPDNSGFVKPTFLKFRVYQARPFRRLFRRGFVQ